MTKKDIQELSDDELRDVAYDLQEQRAASEAKFKAELKVVGSERDRREIQRRVADVPDEVIAAIRAASPKEK